MSYSKTLIFLMVLVCWGVQLYSQKHIGNYQQLLLTGTQSPVKNIDAFLDNPNIARDEIIQNKFYRLIQFFEIPTELEKRAIEKAGIQLFDYIPHKTYVAAIPQDFDATTLRNLNIRSITPLQPFQKISPKIQNDETIVLQYYANLSPRFISDFLKNKNIEIHEFYENIHAAVICKPDFDLEIIANYPITFFISPTPTEAKPEYISGKNIHRSNTLTPKIAGSPQYNGEGIHIAIGDDGMLESHIDFKNRVHQTAVAGDLDGSHGEMVAGILAGAGNLNPLMEGTASHATIHMVNEFETVTMADELCNENIFITSTSYSDGCNRGYTPLAQMADFQTVEHPELMHVFSAGNTGNEDCGYGEVTGWGNITGGVKMGKNVLTVANLDADSHRSPTSSRGPANDGRIKPDIAANGDEQFSTQPNNTYAEANGSSAAAPGVAGILAQLYQAYADDHANTLPNSAFIKAAVLNTADDLGNIGPDFSYGFGRINARRALHLIQNEQVFEATIGDPTTHSFFVEVPEATQQLRVMLYWNDYEGTTISRPALVNDLDLKVVTPSGTTYLPWVLNSSPDSNLLSLPAVRGVDNLNNVEQVTIDLPEGGLYSFLVEGAILAKGNQHYYVVYEFIQKEITLTYPLGGEKLVHGEIEKIHWDAFGNEGNFEIEVSYNNGNTWELLGLVSGEKRSFEWQVPAVTTNQLKIRVQRNNQKGTCLAPISIYEVPQNVHVAEVCPEVVRLEWDAAANASGYLIYKLGEQFMEVFATSATPFIEIPIDHPSEENWYAVAAIGKNGLLGRRSIAVSDGVGLLNCDLDTDISIHSLARPANAILQNCFQYPLTVSINITNSGTALQSNIPVSYQFDNQPVVNEIYNNSIPPTVTVNYIFNTKITNTNIGLHELKVWTTALNDQANFNDSMSFSLEIIPSTSANIPYFQNFDNFDECSANQECDAHCPLSSGWHNDANHLSDDTDWIVYRGSTPSFGTGPDVDQNTNSDEGKYLFLEGSQGCTDKEAYLLSPCFELTSATQPIFSFWYHMKGEDMGQLHVDLFDGENWFYNITLTLSGEQGDDWQKIEIDLTAFVNKTVIIRFRGTTGDGYLTDIAIDNIALVDAHASPYPYFKANHLAVCPNKEVHFIDNSINTPTSWFWKFTPNTVTFVNGTSATDAYPIVLFEEEGTYDVTLMTSNNYGTTQLKKENYISVSKGKSIPFGDDFSDSFLDLEKWKLRNDDHATTWENISTIGRDGFSTEAIFVNNHSYNAVGEKEELQSTVIDLTEATQPFLRFDWAYASFDDSFEDGLQVILSSDCGEYFEHIIFEKNGDDLATVPSQTTSWFPQKSYEWKTAKIDLSDFIGSSVAIRFVNINGFGNNLFLDNFLVYEYQNFPKATLFSYPEASTFCLGEEALTFISTSSSENEFFWNFGASAIPSSSQEYGPHVVVFETTGTYHISLRVKNEWGYDMAETTIHIIDDPVADFDYSLNNNQITFTNHSSFGETFLWDFGDGTTSTLENPSHQYSSNNVYTAKLTVSNTCGKDATQQIITIVTSLEDLENNFFIHAFPNPTNDFILFEMPFVNEPNISFDIIDARGVVVAQYDLKKNNGRFSRQLDVSVLSQGMYFARVQVGEHFFVKRFVKTLN